MLKENHDSDSNLMTWIGLILLILLASFLKYEYPTVISKDSLETIEGKLLKKPNYVDNGENPSYISVYLNGHEKMYKLSGCSLNIIDKELILKMNPGDSIKLCVNSKDYKTKRTFFNKTIEIQGVELVPSRKILTVSMINQCENNAWRRILLLAPLVGLALIFSIIYILKSKWRSS